MAAPPEGVVTYGEAASLLGVAVPVVRGLVAHGILHPATEHRNGFPKLLPAAEVQQFAAHYLAIAVVAKQFQLHGGPLAFYLRESGAPLLAIALPDAGKGHAFFLPRDVAAEIQVPTRRMLKEQAQRRIKAARKRRWLAYKLTRENGARHV